MCTYIIRSPIESLAGETRNSWTELAQDHEKQKELSVSGRDGTGSAGSEGAGSQHAQRQPK